MTPATPTPGRPPHQRTLAAIVFTDVVSFSARIQADELGTLKLLQRDFEEMRRICAEHHGAVLKSTGDGLLLTFTSAVQAVACALAMQRQFAAEAKTHGTGTALQHRIGIHLGDVLVHDEDVMGDGVNIASRLQAEAEPGGICISQTVYDVVKNKLEMNVISLGARELKNISQAMPVYQLLLEAQALDARGRPSRPLRRPAGKAGKPASRTLLVAGGAAAMLVVLLIVGAVARNRAKKVAAEAPPVAVMPAVLSSASASAKSVPGAPVTSTPAVAAPESAGDKVDLAGELTTEFAKRREIMQQLHALYLDKYDFPGLVLALRDKAESPGAAEGLKKMLKASEQLVTLKEWLDVSLRRYSRQHPLMVRDLSGATTKEIGVYLGADGRVATVDNASSQLHDWPELSSVLVGGIIVSAIHDAKRPPRPVIQGAHVFARFYALPLMTEALVRGGR